MGKFYLYLFSTVVVAFAMDSLNINGIFKKNKVYQARIMYSLIAIVFIYILTNFIFDLVTLFNYV